MTGSDETVTKISCLPMVPSNIPKSKRSSEGQDDGKDWSKGWNSTMCWRIAAARGCLSLIALVFIIWYRSALDSKQGSVAYGQPEWAIEPWQLVGGSRIQLAALTGDYDLTSVTPNYEQYLMKLGVPASMVPFVMSSRESFSITDNGDGSFRTKMVTAFDEIDVEFRLNDDYEFSYFFKLGTMQNYCTRPKPHILLIKSYEPSKKWNLTQEMVFTKYGMINTQFFVQEQSRAKKYYTQVVLS